MKKYIKTPVFSLMIVTMSVLLSAGHLYAANNILSADSDSRDLLRFTDVTGFGK